MLGNFQIVLKGRLGNSCESDFDETPKVQPLCTGCTINAMKVSKLSQCK